MTPRLAALPLAAFALLPVVAAAQAAPAAQVLDRVTVSARLADESLETAPASIAVVTGEALAQEGRSNISDLGSRVSNVQLGDLNGSPVLYLRGVGGGGRQVGFDPRTGVTIDGVFMNAPPMSDALLLDLQRVEVLRGPQGSRAGQNTTAGSLELITRTPGEQRGVEALLRTDSLQNKRLAAALNLPTAEGALRTRLSVSLAQGAGEVVNQPTGARADAYTEAAARLRSLLSLGEGRTLDLSADTSAHFDDFPTGEPLTAGNGMGAPTPPGPYSIAVNTPQRNATRNGGVAATLRWPLATATLTSISAYRQSERDWLIDLDYSNADLFLVDFRDDYARLSQELRLNSAPRADGFSWLAGLYAFSQTGDSLRTTLALSQANAANAALQPGDRIDTRPKALTRSLAGYGSVSLVPRERLTVDVGLRVVYAERRLDYQQQASESFQTLGFANAAPSRQRANETALLPDLALSWQWRPALMSYVRYARGSKAGGYDADTLTGARSQPDAFDTETVDSLEAGLKGRFGPAAQTQVRLAAFVSEYRDYQVSQFRPVGTVVLPIISNAGKLRVYGPELELDTPLPLGLTLQSSSAWLYATYAEFENGGPNGLSFSGRRAEFAPRWTSHNVLNKRWPVGHGGLGAVQGALSYSVRSKFFTQPSNRPVFEAEARQLLGAQVLLQHQTGRAQLTLFADNLLDERTTDTINQATLGTVYGRFAPSRSVGVQLALQL